MPAISAKLSNASYPHSIAPASEECATLFDQEFSLLCQTAREVLAPATSTPRLLAITDKDIARDVLLNCGGLGYSPPTAQLAVEQCERALERLRRRRQSVDPIFLSNQHGLDLHSATIRHVDEVAALSLHTGLHYLGMPRASSSHFGLYLEKRNERSQHLVAIASLSAFDLFHLVPAMIPEKDTTQTLVLSRLLSLPCAPTNSVSRLLGGIFRSLRIEQPRIHSLVTYNNPNLGFRGTVYRATNWSLLGFEEKLPDLVLDGEYVSLRQLFERFGTLNYERLKAQLQSRISALPKPLQPLEIYTHRIQRNTWRRQ